MVHNYLYFNSDFSLADIESLAVSVKILFELSEARFEYLMLKNMLSYDFSSLLKPDFSFLSIITASKII